MNFRWAAAPHRKVRENAAAHLLHYPGHLHQPPLCARARPDEVPLLADLIRLLKPPAELGVNIRGPREPECVHVVPWRDRLHAAETWALYPASQHHVPIEPPLPRCDLSERHPNLECDPSLFRQDPDGSASPHRAHHDVEKRPNRRILLSEVAR